MRLAEAARTVVRSVTGEPSLERVLALAEPALTEGFQAAGLVVWIHDAPGPDRVHRTPGVPTEPPHLAAALRRVARDLWREQRLSFAGRGQRNLARLDDVEAGALLEHLTEIGVASILVVPIGVADQCLGCVVLGRREGDHDWSDVEAAGALAVGHDLGSVVLNARALERERRTNEELRELDRYRTRLIATVSHELKNPLTSVLGHLEILDSVDGLPRPVERSLGAMERGARRMRRVVDDLLLLSRVTDPDTPLALRPTDLRVLVDEAVDLHAVTAARSGVNVEVVDDGRSVRAVVDVDEMDRVVSNLLGNAVKYSPEGGTVRLSLRRVGGEIELCVTDEGIGISAEDQERLFEEFYRSTNPIALALPGTGLGLPIVRRIVDRHGGRIEVDSELGRGSTFRVVLPAG
nr:GAF domain-containing sensor histidine kinase [Nocardioides sp. zg-DK7169]